MLGGIVLSLDGPQARRLTEILSADASPGRSSVDFVVPNGWERESDTLYLHASGVRIERRVYRKTEGWVLVPVDLDRAVMVFSPTREGMEQAFSAFARGVLEPKDAAMTQEVREAREAARRDEDPFASSDDEEEDEEDEGELA